MPRCLLAIALASLITQPGMSAENPAIKARLDRLEAEVVHGEDVRAIKKLQRSYGYYVDKGLWDDVADLFAGDAVANYPNGVFIGKPSIREHLVKNIGNGKIGLGDGRLYDHTILQPVIHLDPGGHTAHGRWRTLAMFGTFGGGATWAEGVYEFTYTKDAGVWKIQTLDYYSGFGAPYATGWIANTGPRPGRPRELAYPPDRPPSAACEGFPAACIPPFHYKNPGTVWTAGDSLTGQRDVPKRAADLVRRAARLAGEQEIENLQRIYGYYVDRGMWDEVADLFASDATIEMGLRGVYVGQARIRKFLEAAGPRVVDGVLNDHLQLQIVADVAPDGLTAQARSRELAMTGVYQGQGAWSEGVFENTFVKQGGVWKFKSMHFYPTFITDYDQGWAKDAQPAPGPIAELPPDRPPTEVYEIYPKAHVPPFHYRNPVTGKDPGPAANPPKLAGKLEPAIENAERQIQRVKDYYDVENLESAYGYYLDKNLWNNLADLFAKDGSMELAQRGVYVGREHIRGFLQTVFGRGAPDGPVAGRLGNHLQLQPVIHVSADGATAKIRVRLVQQLSMNGRATLGAGIYENEAIKEDGVWKLKTDHTYNTFTANYNGGWAKSPGTTLPGPSKDYRPDRPPTLVFAMFPNVYTVPFHYAQPARQNFIHAVADLGRSAAFYSALGLTPSGKSTFDVPGESFSLELTESAGPKHATALAHIQDPGAQRLVLSVRNLDLATTASNRAGGSVITPGAMPVEFRGAARAIAVRDPDGLIIELVQFLPLPQTSAPLESNIIGGRISISVSDLDKTAAFYRDVLGFQVKPPSKLAPNENVMQLFDAVGGQWRFSMANVPGSSTQWEFAEFRDIPRTPVPARKAPAFSLQLRNLQGLLRDPDGILLELTAKK